jgi:hypothetical protein
MSSQPQKKRLTTSAMIASIAAEGQPPNEVRFLTTLQKGDAFTHSGIANNHPGLRVRPATDIAALQAAFDAACSWPDPQPRVIICDTRMGKGVSKPASDPRSARRQESRCCDHQPVDC